MLWIKTCDGYVINLAMVTVLLIEKNERKGEWVLQAVIFESPINEDDLGQLEYDISRHKTEAQAKRALAALFKRLPQPQARRCHVRRRSKR